MQSNVSLNKPTQFRYL